MNPFEERLNQLETRVTRYRNFNILLCLLLVAVVSVAATDGISIMFRRNQSLIPSQCPKAMSGFPIYQKKIYQP